jgi:hypothetical protein
MQMNDADRWRITSYGKTALETDLANIKRIMPVPAETEARCLALLRTISDNPRIATIEIYAAILHDFGGGETPPNTFWLDSHLEFLLKCSLIKRQWFRR